MVERVKFPMLGRHKTVAAFKDHLAALDPSVPCDDEILPAPQNPLAQPLTLFGKTLFNRFAIQPMEGWDGDTNGNPGPLTIRRWENFGKSGAALIWGGEAVAVQASGRANPNQLLINPDTLPGLENLRLSLMKAHHTQFGPDNTPVIGLQLTHSGRFARPRDKTRLEPRIACAHPVLDKKFDVETNTAVLTDDEVRALIGDFVQAAVLAQKAGYDFVDIKHCHGYLLHEFLGAHQRQGPYGGTFENRTRILREVAAGVRQAAPGLAIGVRLSAVDMAPFRKSPDGQPVGVAEDPPPDAPRWGFGIHPQNPLLPDATETHAFLDLLTKLDIEAVNISIGSPYYNPHIQRPAAYPPSDGYLPPEDPLLGVVRHLQLVRELKARHPALVFVGSAYTYLQQFLPHVAQAVVREGWADVVGLGRMVLSYPHLPADVLAGGPLDSKLICRTFSDCTTAPRGGLVSGCYPLDHFYKAMPESDQLRALKRGDA